jgi:two-component system NtrC family sensor kinase
MKTSSRLILLLTATVATVMVVSGYFNLRQREHSLVSALHDEARAYALTLQIALETDSQSLQGTAPKRLIDRLSGDPKVYSIILFDEAGHVTLVSDPPNEGEVPDSSDVHRVLATGEPVERMRRMLGEQVFSVIMPMRAGERLVGAFEITEVMSDVRSDISKARWEIAITTLLLFATIFVVVLLVARQSLSRPIRELLAGATAVGLGNLDYRVPVPENGGEFGLLADEFNRMADSLVEQKRTAEREAEGRLALERELRHTERLATVGRVAAGVAHEIGAPLNVLDGRAQQLLVRPDAPLEMRQRNLTIIRSQAGRITRIVRQLINLARPHDIRFELLDLSLLIASMLELIEEDAKKAGVIITVDPLRNLLIDGDHDLLLQVLLNICLNGIQAMPKGGRLRIECLEEEPDKYGKRLAGLRISDTGHGIPPEALSHIFEPFYTTKDDGQGTGLGLTISRRMIEEHGGRIDAFNNVDGGATFTVYLWESSLMCPSPAPVQPGVRHDKTSTVNR